MLLEEADLDEATYYVSRFEVGYARIPRLPGPAGRVFTLLKNAAADPIQFHKLPLDRTVTMSSHITCERLRAPPARPVSRAG